MDGPRLGAWPHTWHWPGKDAAGGGAPTPSLDGPGSSASTGHGSTRGVEGALEPPAHPRSRRFRHCGLATPRRSARVSRGLRQSHLTDERRRVEG